MPRSKKSKPSQAARGTRQAMPPPGPLSRGDLSKLSREVLELRCAQRHLTTTGSKASLIERLLAHRDIPEYAQNPSTSTQDSPNITPGFSQSQLHEIQALISSTIAACHTQPSQPMPLSPAISVQQNPPPTVNPIPVEPLPLHVPSTGPAQPALHTAFPALVNTEVNQVTEPHPQHTSSLPALPQKTLQKILKREYINFNDLLPANLYPTSHLANAKQYTLKFANLDDPNALSITPVKPLQRKIHDLATWLEAWNTYIRVLVAYYPSMANDLLTYQDQISKFSSKFRTTAWLMYDTAFRHQVASNQASWRVMSEPLYNDLLKEETLPFCSTCHSYGHRQSYCPTRNQAQQQPFRSTAQPAGHTSTPAKLTTSSPINPVQPTPFCRDFNRRQCTRPNCQYTHACNRKDCGGPHPGSRCPLSSTQQTPQ